MKNIGSEITANAILLNGGYFENPLYLGNRKEISIRHPYNSDGKWYKDKQFTKAFPLCKVDGSFRRYFGEDEEQIRGWQGVVRFDVS
jgi:hypothetical protein